MTPTTRPHAISLMVLLLGLASAASAMPEQRGPMVIYQAEAEFSEARNGLKDAIINQGIVISNVLHASDMLNRTAPDLGIDHNVYLHAETFEFCKASLSHELVALDPANMMACPYAIGVYELSGQAGTVYLAYRRPQAVPGSEAITGRIEALLREIIEGTLEFL